MKPLSLLVAFLFISVFDLPKLIKEKNKKEIIIYAIFLGAAFVVSESRAFRWPLWSPDRMISDIVRFFIE